MKNSFNSARAQSGFTLVELVVVMVILGILAATALPKFMNVNSQAHQAAVAGTGGAFGSAVALARAQWIANGSTAATANVTGFGDNDVDTNASGWPVGTGGNSALTTIAQCIEVWNGIMQNPAAADTAANAAANPGTVDYVATVTGNTCTFTYQGAAGLTITYNSTNGNVTVDDLI